MGEITTVDERVAGVEQFFAGQFKRIEGSLPEGIEAARFTRIIVTEFQRNPDLFACMTTPQGKASVFASMMTAAQLGLEIGSHLGQAFMIPRKAKRQGGAVMCSFQLGYQGLIQLAYNSGVLADIRCRAVYNGEEFKYRDGLKPVLYHVPSEEPQTDKDLRAVYCILTYTSGIRHPEVMWEWELERIVKKSGAYQDSMMWKDWRIEGYLKTVLKRALKYCPKGTQMRAVGRAIAADDGLVTLEPEIVDLGQAVVAEEHPEKTPPPDLPDRDPVGGVTLEGHYIVKQHRPSGLKEWICQCGVILTSEAEVSQHESEVKVES